MEVRAPESRSDTHDRQHESSNPTPQPLPISAHEPLTRYVTDSDYLGKRSPTTVHWRAFRPKPDEAELSIARITELTSEQVWHLGDAMAAGPSGRTVVGRADFGPTDVRSARVNSYRLDAVQNEPPVRHALIVGWPADGDARKTLAMLLAAASAQVRR